jgi:hypothetical protein
MVDRLTRYGDVHRYRFSDADRQRFEGVFWRLPRRLVTDGTWARLWRERGGGGTVSAILPVLAMHARFDGDARWTDWACLSARRIAALSSTTKDAPGMIFAVLERLGFAVTRPRRRERYEGGHKREFRLSSALFPQRDELFVQVPGGLFYGGFWSLLPTHASRHLLLTLAALDPVRDEKAYSEYLQEVGAVQDGFGGDDADAEVLGRRRSSPLSVSDIEEASGLSRTAVFESLSVLLAPVTQGGVELGRIIERVGDDPGTPRSGRPFSYAFRSSVLDRLQFNPDGLNSRDAVRAFRSINWPGVTARAQRSAARRTMTGQVRTAGHR